MTVLGLEEGKLALYPHDETWETIAQETMRAIRAIMKEDCLAIEHVGGTSIRCAWSKPIIDILVLVSDYSVIDTYVPQLKEIGIEYLGEMVPGMRMGTILKPGQNICTHHIHFITPDCSDWQAFINIRDFCNRDPLGGTVYSDSKRLYADGNENMRVNYRNSKCDLYSVLRQCGQTMHEIDLGLKSGYDFLDAFFYTALGKLEDPAFIDEAGRTVLKYRTICGTITRAAVKLKQAAVPVHTPIMVQMSALPDRITMCLAVLFYGGIIECLPPEASEEAIAGITPMPSAAYIADDAFFKDITHYRNRQTKASRDPDEPALMEPNGTGSFRTVCFSTLSDEIMQNAEMMQNMEEPVLTPASYERFSDQFTEILAALTAGRVIQTHTAQSQESKP